MGSEAGWSGRSGRSGRLGSFVYQGQLIATESGDPLGLTQQVQSPQSTLGSAQDTSSLMSNSGLDECLFLPQRELDRFYILLVRTWTAAELSQGKELPGVVAAVTTVPYHALSHPSRGILDICDSP